MPDFARMLDELQYSLIVLIAGIHWSLQEAILMAGFTVKLVNNWLIENAFMPIIAQTNNSLGIAVSYVFVVALLVLGITYLLAAFIRLEVVSPRSAIIWYIAGALFFTIGPSFYQGMNEFRLNIGQVMYLSVLQGLEDNAGDFSSLAQVDSNDLDLGPLCDQLDVYLPGATGPGPIDGLDIALAYLRGHAQDVMGYPQPAYSPGCGVYLQNPNPSTWAGEGGTSVVPLVLDDASVTLEDAELVTEQPDLPADSQYLLLNYEVLAGTEPLDTTTWRVEFVDAAGQIYTPSSAAFAYTDFDVLPLEIPALSSLSASVGYIVPDTLPSGHWVITDTTGNGVSFTLSFAVAPLDLRYNGVDVRLVSVTYVKGKITTHLRIYNGRSEILHLTQDDIWLALGYAPEPPGPRNPAEGLTPFNLLPEQAVDLTLMWYWDGEPYASMGVGDYRFAIQLIR